MAVFEARLKIVGLAVGNPLGAVLFVLSFASVAYYARLGVVGLSRPSIAVVSGPDVMPRWPAGRRPSTSRELIEDLVIGLRSNRAPIAAALVLMLSAIAVGVAGGGLGARTAAASGQPAASPAIEGDSGAQ
jgi:hypothetical protein